MHCSVSTTSANRTIPWGCDIDSLENASALQKWLSDSGLPPQKMAIERVEVGERGLVALKNIRKGEKLLFVPPSLFITADSVRNVWCFRYFFLEFVDHTLIAILFELCGYYTFWA